ncbi:MAG: Mur ligase family protein [Gammaproteobacteria bacterium]
MSEIVVMEIPHPESSRLIMDDCRRLTGPSLVWERTGAILDVLIDDMDMDAVLDCWYRHVNQVLAQINWPDPELTHRRFENGFNLVIAAPIDQLYAATLILETAWYYCVCELLGIEARDPDVLVRDIHGEIREERNPALLELQQSATEHLVDFLVDDDTVSVGHGEGSVSWAVDQVPASDQIDWSGVHDVPVALITGTNGKSTSVRLLDGIAKAAGQISGVTSTDFVRVGDDVLETGDYSGPGGARLLLRDPRVQAAFLEVARGGILRRGLPLRRASAALVTNVARDHLGQYGVNMLEALIETKFVVREALAEEGVLVTNADDAGILAFMESADQDRVCWFSLDRAHPRIRQQLDRRGRCCFTDGDSIVYFDGREAQSVCAIDAIPMTMGGAARHNVQNALGAIGVADAMGYSIEAIRQGLTRFNSDEHDNPGRLNSFDLKNGARVIVDFAHNAHSVAAVADTVSRIPARQKWALFGSAGDRSDDEIAAIATGVCSLSPDYVVLAEVEQYLRGRAPGEVSEIMRQACINAGLSESQIKFAASPLAGVRLALAAMQADDLGLFLVLSERDEVIHLVGEY